MDHCIECVNLTKFYGNQRGIENLNIKINNGIIFGFLGPNGAGKTTTIRCLLGILNPTNGYVKIFGHEIRKWSTKIFLKENIGYLPGEFDLYKHFTVKSLLDYFVSLRKRPPNLRERLVDFFELDESRKIDQLSKGNKQKVGLIQALMHDPDLIILDEPTSGLDPLIQLRVYSLLKELRDQGRTIFFSSHNLSEVQKICDEVGIIRKGLLVSHEHIDKLRVKLQQKIIFSSETSIDTKLSELSVISHFDKIQSNHDGHRYSVFLKSSKLDFSEFFNVLKGFKIYNVVIPEPNLEDYFIQYYKDQ